MMIQCHELLENIMTRRKLLNQKLECYSNTDFFSQDSELKLMMHKEKGQQLPHVQSSPVGNKVNTFLPFEAAVADSISSTYEGITELVLWTGVPIL